MLGMQSSAALLGEDASPLPTKAGERRRDLYQLLIDPRSKQHEKKRHQWQITKVAE
jgi:hypothetical protein